MFSFRKRKKYVDASPFLRRIIDRTTATGALLNDCREQNRYSRTLPVVLAPWRDGAPDMNNVAFGITKDISDSGMSLVTTLDFHSDIVFAFLLDTAITDRILCFRGEPKRSLKVVQGISEYGLYVAEMLNEHHSGVLEPFSSLIEVEKTKRSANSAEIVNH